MNARLWGQHLGWGLPLRVSPAAGELVTKLGLDGLGTASHVRCLSGVSWGPLLLFLAAIPVSWVRCVQTVILWLQAWQRGRALGYDSFSDLCLLCACCCPISHSKPRDRVNSRWGEGPPKDTGTRRGAMTPCCNLRHILIPKVLKYEKYTFKNTLNIIVYYI